MRKRTKLSTAIALAVALVAGGTYAQVTDQDYGEGIVSDQGSIRLPDSFRTDYVMLGAWSVAGDADTGGAIGLHVVYAPRSAVDGYRQTGKFPGGTVLVKELFNGSTTSIV